MNEPVSLQIFYAIYAKEMSWQISRFHLEALEFLDAVQDLGLLQLPRGHGKSTMIEIYIAWCTYKDPIKSMMLVQSSTEKDSYKTSKGVQSILEKHPLTKGMILEGGVQRWYTKECADTKHGTLYCRGVLSNVTGARAHTIISDDCEVPSTIASQELRDKLAYRLGEQIHILIPGGKRLFAGTPHTHENDSLYTKLLNVGAESFIRPMYAYSNRLLDVKKGKVYKLDVYGDDVSYDIFSGIGANSLIPSYTIINNHIVFKEDHSLIDVYHSALWEDRFTNDVMLQRRKECLSLNEWDSQYMLNSKPLGESPLELSLFKEYNSELEVKVANRERVAMIGDKKIISSSLCFDPSSGKVGRDVAAVSLVFKDEQGKLYWHRCVGVTGEIATTDKEGRIVGGQVMQIIDLIKEYRIPCITVETNGIGGHVPAILKAALKTRGISCGVTEIHTSTNKNKRIMNIQSYLLSGALFIHNSVLANPAIVKEINNFNPLTTKNKDDHLDSLASCLLNIPSSLGFIDIHNETQSLNNYYQKTQAVVAQGW